MKIKSFGCSFIYGSDLCDVIETHEILKLNGPQFSNFTWPALIAKQLGVEYESYALPGQGNFKILCDVIAQASLNDPSLTIINWTWIDRFDYINNKEQWHTLRPSEDNNLEKFYYKNLHSQFQDTLKSVYYVNTAIDFLLEKKYPFLMTFMDYSLLTPIDPNWHDPKYLEVIQHKISNHLTNFERKNFLDWSRKNNFAISARWHPLEEAHAAAADYMLPKVKQKFDHLSDYVI